MGIPSPTFLIVFLHPSNEEHALYLISEIPSCEHFTLRETTEELLTSPLAEPFTLSFKQKRLTLAFPAPLTCQAIKEIAQFVATGLLLGFIVQGEVNLGESSFNNIHGDLAFPGIEEMK